MLRRTGPAADTELVTLADLNIGPCTGCHVCQETGACHIEDDMVACSEKLLAADAFVLATPSYMGGVTSGLQAFIERSWPLRKGQLNDKVATYIVTGRRRIGAAASALEEYFTRLGVVKVPGVLGFGFEAGSVVDDTEAVERTRAVAAALVRTARLIAENGDVRS